MYKDVKMSFQDKIKVMKLNHKNNIAMMDYAFSEIATKQKITTENNEDIQTRTSYKQIKKNKKLSQSFILQNNKNKETFSQINDVIKNNENRSKGIKHNDKQSQSFYMQSDQNQINQENNNNLDQESIETQNNFLNNSIVSNLETKIETEKKYFQTQNLFQPKQEVISTNLYNQLNNQEERFNILDKSLLKAFYYDDHKQKDEQTLQKMKEQNPDFDIKKYKLNKMQVNSKIANLPTTQTRLKQVGQNIYKNHKPIDINNQQDNFYKKVEYTINGIYNDQQYLFQNKKNQNSIIINQYVNWKNNKERRQRMFSVQGKEYLKKNSKSLNQTEKQKGYIENIPYIQMLEVGKIRNDFYTKGHELDRKQLKINNKTKRYRDINLAKKFISKDFVHQKNKNVQQLEYLIHYDSNLVGIQDETIQQDEKQQQNILIRRCFHYCSNQQDSNVDKRFQEVHQEQFIKLIQMITNQYQIPVEQIKKVYAKVTEWKKNDKVMNFYDFTEGLRRISLIYFQTKYQDKNNNNLNDIPDINQMLDQFIKETISIKKDVFLDKIEIQLDSFSKLKEIQDYLNMFKDILKQIFIFFGQLRSVKLIDIQNYYMGFSDVFQVIWKLGFFPTQVTKTEIKKFYYYTISQHQGLNFKDFTKFMHFIGHFMISKQNAANKIEIDKNYFSDSKSLGKNQKSKNKQNLDIDSSYNNSQRNSSFNEKKKVAQVQKNLDIKNILNKLEHSDDENDDYDQHGNLIKFKREQRIYKRQQLRCRKDEIREFLTILGKFYIDLNNIDDLNIHEKLKSIQQQNFNKNLND